MKYKDFPPAFQKKIQACLTEAKRSTTPPIAAFDADGTLWDTDLGEAFFDYLIENKKVKLPHDPWSFYLDTKKQNAPQAYLWLAQICAGHSLEEIRSWALDCVQKLRPPIFNPQKELIHYLKSEGVQIYIITASVKWAVEPGAQLLGLQHDSVLGVETESPNGIISEKQKGAITYRAGKVDALLEKTKGQKPFFCSGNSEGDQELLLSSVGLSLAVSAARPDDPLYRTETQLLKLATNKGWLTHRFVEDGNS